MSLHTMYGINGVGKDTIAQELRNRNQNLVTVTESRMLMYLLGITNNFDAMASVTRSQYAQLENTPQERIREVEIGGPMEELVGNVSAGHATVLSLSHLVFATYLDGAVNYLQKPKADWYLKSSDTFMQIVAPHETVLARRVGESATRARVIEGVHEISYHQSLCDLEWDRIASLVGATTPMAVIENIALDESVASAERIVYGS